MARPKVAFYWCASCGGCEEAIVDLDEDLLKVAEAVDIVFWPAALDFKRKNVEALADGEIAVSFINGSVRLEEQEEMVKLLRKKSGLVVAFGSCSHMGGIPALANSCTRDTIFQRVYKEVPTVENQEGITPQVRTAVDAGELTLPEFYDTVKPLDKVIPVDYYLPGCPPPSDLIMNAINAILKGELPARGAVLAPNKVLCDTCPRGEERPDRISIDEILRPHTTNFNAWKCFLEQGIICCGPATRSGCGERCLRANMPCRGCMGPIDGVADQRAEALSQIASLLGVGEEAGMTEEEFEKLCDEMLDQAGTFHRFSLPASSSQEGG